MIDQIFPNPFLTSICTHELTHWKEMVDEWVAKMKNDLQLILSSINNLYLIKAVMQDQEENYKYGGFRQVQVTLLNGRRVKVFSPVFIHNPCKGRGRPPKRNKGVLHHVGLELLGFIDKKSLEFISAVVRAAVSLPSFQAAATELAYQGISVSHEQVRKLTYRYADIFMGDRVANALDGSEKQSGLDLEITIDGGRTRMLEELRKKDGRRKNTTYNGQWREPVLFSIRVRNQKGELLCEVPQLLDGTMKNWKKAFGLLERYLTHYNLKEAKKITFLADGSKSIWNHLEPMMRRLGVNEYKAVVDYMHAKQNLNIVIDMMNKKQNTKKGKITREEMYNLLWAGDIKGIETYITNFFNSKRRGKKTALNKMNNYFEYHERFDYKNLVATEHPIGSGSIESAIRRVINMKLKGNGIFWLEDNCEKMIYLRCQFLTGRWNTLKDKVDKQRLNLYKINELECFQEAC